MENTDARVLLQHIYNTYGYQISKNFKDNAIRDAFELADKALEKQITEKEQAMHKANDISSVKAELKAQENDLRQQLAECESQIAKSDTAADEQRLEELRAEQGKSWILQNPNSCPF
jgi:uncharacterized tellurite resistance protein B-like protein